MSTTAKQTTAYKGFDENLQCRGHVFEVGKTYEHDGVIVCCPNSEDIKDGNGGFHACTTLFDVWGYYGPADSRFAEVTLGGDSDKTVGGDSKVASGKITIEAELSLPEFIKKAVVQIIEATKGKKSKTDSDYARIGSSGYSARIGSTGDYARIGSTGDSARIGSTGYSARIKAEGENAVIASAGYAAQVRGSKGTWVSVAEFDKDGKCIGFATGCIGKKGLNPDTWYQASGGKLVEVGQ